MTKFLSLIGGIKGIIVIVLIFALGGYIFIQKRNVTAAETARDLAVEQRNSVALERDKAIIAAKENKDTIDRLEMEKEFANKAIIALQTAKETNRVNTITREIIIKNQASAPANAAQAAPVLGDIISEIQADRVRRRSNIQEAFSNELPFVTKGIQE